MTSGAARHGEAAHRSGTRGTGHSRTAGTQHGSGSHAAAGAGARPDRAGAQPGQAAGTAPLPADRSTDKLLAPVGEPVRDPAVQEEIRRAPALREAWSDPDVRRIVTRQP